MDLRLTIQDEIATKPLRSRWVPSHEDIAKAKTKDERVCLARGAVGVCKAGVGGADSKGPP